MWVDGFNGVAHHLRQTMNFAIIAQAGILELREWGREQMIDEIKTRGIDSLNLLDLRAGGRGQWDPKLNY